MEHLGLTDVGCEYVRDWWKKKEIGILTFCFKIACKYMETQLNFDKNQNLKCW